MRGGEGRGNTASQETNQGIDIELISIVWVRRKAFLEERKISSWIVEQWKTLEWHLPLNSRPLHSLCQFESDNHIINWSVPRGDRHLLWRESLDENNEFYHCTNVNACTSLCQWKEPLVAVIILPREEMRTWHVCTLYLDLAGINNGIRFVSWCDLDVGGGDGWLL